MSESNLRAPDASTRLPGYVDETELVLGTSFFYDEPRETALYEDLGSLAGEELGARRNAYIGALSLIARTRAEDRRLGLVSSGERPALTTRKVGDVAIQFWPERHVLARRLAMLNGFERGIEEGYAHQGLRDHQLSFLAGVLEGLQKGPQKVTLPPWWEGGGDFYLPGVLVNAPTGAGKTAVAARTIVALGIGRPPAIRYDHPEARRPLRFLMIEPSQMLIKYMAGGLGKGIFSKLMPGLSIGANYQIVRRPGADVVLTTPETFVAKFSHGEMDGFPIDVIGIDEVHHLTEPQFLLALLERWDGPTIGFTATPAYNHLKDARSILRHEVRAENESGEADVIEMSRRGILNKVATFSLVVTPADVGMNQRELAAKEAADRRQDRQLATAVVARDVALPLIAEGRRGIIFCEPGGESLHAQQVAEMLRGRRLPSGRAVVAEAVGTFRGAANEGPNVRLFADFEAGKIDVLTTVMMGNEGLHLDGVSFVIVACKITSVLKLFQMGGRALGLNELFPTSLLININTLGFGQEQYYAQTFAGIYGGDTIEQGMIYGTWKPSKTAARATDRSEIVSPDFPSNINSMLDRVNHKTVAEAYFTRSEAGEGPEVPEGYKPLSVILQQRDDVNPHHARYALLRAGYKFIGRTEEDGIYVRYYEPAAETYFSANPKPPADGLLLTTLLGSVTASEFMAIEEAAKRVDLHKRTLIRDYITSDELAASAIRRVAGRRMRGWERATGEAVVHRLKQILVIPAHLVPFRLVADRLDARYDTVYEYAKRLWEELSLEDMQRGNRHYIGVPWWAIPRLERQYFLKGGLKPLELKGLPGGSQMTAEEERHARYMQRQLGVPESWLPDPTPTLT